MKDQFQFHLFSSGVAGAFGWTVQGGQRERWKAESSDPRQILHCFCWLIKIPDCMNKKTKNINSKYKNLSAVGRIFKALSVRHLAQVGPS